MDKVTLQDRRDFPLTTNSLAFMQAAYAALEKLGYIGGDNYIVTGCVVTGSSAAPGYMFLKGILMPFLGGTITTNVKIVKVVTTINVDAGVREQTSYRAEFGTSANPDDNVAWADIVRTDTIISLMSQMTALNNRLTNAEDDILVNAQDIQGLDDKIALKPDDDEVYAARIFETAENVTVTENKKEHTNKDNFINSVSTVSRTFRFIFSAADAEWQDKYMVFLQPNSSNASSIRKANVHPISGGTGFDVNLRDSSQNAQLDAFWIIIRKKA